MQQDFSSNYKLLIINLEAIRHRYLQIFYEFKLKSQYISKEILYLAIAISDKYIQKISESDTQQTQLRHNMHLKVLASLWMAWKFLEVDHIPLKKLLEKIQITGCEAGELVDVEYEILIAIDFHIPQDCVYAAMIRAYQLNWVQVKNKITIVSQCLAFLKQAIGISSDFSLCPQLGCKIFKLFDEKIINDVRIRQAYAKINKKISSLANKALQTS